MSKTIFFNIPATGHINPSLPLVAELVQRGEQVICVNTEESREKHERLGAQFQPYPHIPELAGLIQRASGGDLAGNALALVQIAERLLPFVLDLLRKERPRYVIYDSLCSWAKQATEALKLRSAASVVTFALGPGAMPPVTPGMLAHILAGLAPRFPAYWQTARRMKQKFGVKGVGLTGALMNLADINIVYTSREFQPAGERFADHFKFVGPSISAARADGADFPFDQLTRRPVVYISLGTINNDNLDFYQQCFTAFADHPGQFILSTGKNTDLRALKPIPANFIVRGFVPQLEVLKRVDAFVTHGGLNSVSEGLYYGVPLIATPQQVEQALVAQQVAKQRAGLALGDKPPFGRVSAPELRAAVGHVLGDITNFKREAERIGDTFRAAGGYQRAADEIIRFAKQKKG
jgi:hypothetical protein